MGRMDFKVRCTDPERKNEPAKYKIAAEWTGGDFTELKTFGFADDVCLDRVLKSAQERAEKIRLVEGEKLGELRVYLLDVQRHDYELQQVSDPAGHQAAADAKGSK